MPTRTEKARGRGAAAAAAGLAALLALAPLPASGAAGGGGTPRLGFFPASRPAQERAEAVFLDVPTPERTRRWLRDLTEEPRVAGTEADRRSAEYVRRAFESFGLETETVAYKVLLNYPKEVALRLVEPEQSELELRERGHPTDKDSYSREAFPAFHGYGASGSAAGEVVYANYGRKEDFDKLEEMGVSPRGRIVLARYGRVYRGVKVYQAQERGAAGVLLYSDPADDGYMKGDVYPQGPMRPEWSLQRGSVRAPNSAPGDPTTPGAPSRPGAKRLSYDRATGLPRIPSLPISYGVARKILSALGGERVPDAWQGGLPFAYHVGPGAARVEMKVEMDYALRSIWNVVAKVPGTAEPQRWVVLGNHRDAWTHGAVDPGSGTAAMLEAARGVAEAVAAGWKPRRTVLFASWDAEEYGLVGATELVEDRLRHLEAGGVAYINLDVAATGPDLDVGGVPSLRDLIVEAAAAVPEPKKGGSLLQAWERRLRSEWAREEPVCLHGPEETFELRLRPLGSGSDFTPFIDHAGVASVDFSFDGPYGVYHSTIDDLLWMDRFGDPAYLYHTAAARLYGLLAMRLAGAEVVPLRYAPYARELERLLDKLRRDLVRERRLAGAAEPTPGKPPERPPLSPDFSAIEAALAEFAAAAREVDAAVERAVETGRAGAEALARLNDALAGVERSFLLPEGLPGRPWYRHALYAPDIETYYGSAPLPGLVQASQGRDAAMFDSQAAALVGRLREASARLREAAALAREAAAERGAGGT
jgi:N-acetylated-alpha-linked acidic dipeptidase